LIFEIKLSKFSSTTISIFRAKPTEKQLRRIEKNPIPRSKRASRLAKTLLRFVSFLYHAAFKSGIRPICFGKGVSI